MDRLALEFLRDLPPLDHFDDNDALHAGYNPCLVKAVALVYVAQIKLALAQQGRVAYGDQAVLEIATRVVDLLGRAHTAAGLDILVGVRSAIFRRLASRSCISVDLLCIHARISKTHGTSRRADRTTREKPCFTPHISRRTR